MAPRKSQASNHRAVALRRPALPDFLGRICSGDDRFSSLQLCDASEAISELASEVAAASGDLLSHVDEPTVRSLMSLFGLALRRSDTAASTTTSEDERAVYRQLRSTLAAEFSKVVGDKALVMAVLPGRQALLLTLALRCRVLRAYAKLLRAYAKQLQQRRSRRNMDAANEVLAEAEELMHGLSGAYSAPTWSADGSSASASSATTSGTGAASGATVAAAQASFRSRWEYGAALASELSASQLMEAWALCFLQLLTSEQQEALAAGGGSGGRSSSGDTTVAASMAANQLSRFAGSAHKLDTVCCREPAHLRLAHAAPSPGLQYLLAAQVVSTVALLDGGSSYGLQAAKQRGAPAVPVFTISGRLVCPGSTAYEQADTVMLRWAMTLWEEHLQWRMGSSGRSNAQGRKGLQQLQVWRAEYASAAATAGSMPAVPPLGSAAMFDLCLRTSRAAADSWRLRRAAARRRAGGGVRCVVDRDEVAATGLAALRAARSVLHFRRHARAAVPTRSASDDDEAPWQPDDLERLRGLWSAFVRLLEVVLEPPPIAEEPRGGSGRGGADVVGTAAGGGDVDGQGNVYADMLDTAEVWTDRLDSLRGGLAGGWDELPACQPDFDSKTLHCFGPQLLPGPAEAMLAAGGIPACERLLRRYYYISDIFGRPSNWFELILHGPLLPLLSLTVSATKVARRAAVQVAALPSPCRPVPDGHSIYMQANPTAYEGFVLLRKAVAWLGTLFPADRLADCMWVEMEVEAPEWAAAGGSSGGRRRGGAQKGGKGDGIGAELDEQITPGSPQGRQVLLLFSFAAATLLPACAHALQRSLAEVCRIFASRAQGTVDAPAAYMPCLGDCIPLLRWVSLLVAAHMGAQSEAAGGALQPSPADWTNWGNHLLGAVDVFGVLGSVARLLVAAGDPGAGGVTDQKPAAAAEEREAACCFQRALMLCCYGLQLELCAALHLGGAPPGVRAAADSASCSVHDGRTTPLELSWIVSVVEPGGSHPDPQVLEEVEKLAGLSPERPSAPPALLRPADLAAAAALVSPLAMPAMMPVRFCCNWACTNLEGPSELDLPCLKCGGCGGIAHYCSKECQREHWKAGHKKQCGYVASRH